jgi:hypothetical protein
MFVRASALLTGLILFASIPCVLQSHEVVVPAAPVKIYDAWYAKEPGRTHWQLYPREVEVVNVPDAPTTHQFAAVAMTVALPAPGWHEIIVQHPLKQQTVLVRFKLHIPLSRVVASERTLQFWYVDGARVEIRFPPTGQVRVEKVFANTALNP